MLQTFVRILILVCVLYHPLKTYGSVEVAFIEVRDRSGNLIELDRGGRFAHVAIRVNKFWLHAHPINGVEIVDSLAEVGEVKEILSSETHPGFNREQIISVIGSRYDHSFSWEHEGTYCSKLVAKLLNIPPTPMAFDGSYWAPFKNLPRGEPGISPDLLFKALLARNFVSHKGSQCSSVFRF